MSEPSASGGGVVYHPPGQPANGPDSIRVMPPGSSPVPGLEQCPFEVYDDQRTYSGHGSTAETAVVLFRFLNSDVTAATVREDGRTILEFEDNTGIRIKSDETGYESYIINSSENVYIFY